MSYWRWIFNILKGIVRMMLDGAAEAVYGMLMGVFAGLILIVGFDKGQFMFMFSGGVLEAFAFLLTTHGFYRVMREEWKYGRLKRDEKRNR